MFEKIFNYFGYYKIDHIKIGCHCGLCGDWMPKQIIDKEWTWGICDNCRMDNLDFNDRIAKTNRKTNQILKELRF